MLSVLLFLQSWTPHYISFSILFPILFPATLVLVEALRIMIDFVLDVTCQVERADRAHYDSERALGK